MNYYSDVFTLPTWRSFVEVGASTTGFSAGMASRAAAVEVGDRFLCYLRGHFAWVGALEAISKSYMSDEPIWGEEKFPVRVDVRPVVVLPTDQGLPIKEMEGKVTFFSKGQYLGSVPSNFQGSPRRLKPEDGEIVWRALLALDDGVESAAIVASAASEEPATQQAQNRTAHAEIQHLLADFGLRMGCRVWIPKADRAAVLRAAPGFDAGALLAELPMVFAGHAQETVRNIDVLWLRGSTIVAAFEIEHTTSIYSGLLRMSDLVAEFPNVAFPLFVVSPEERRNAVRAEITRPTFQTLPRPLAAVAGFIGYERLRSLVAQFPGETARYVNAEVIGTIAVRFDS